MSALPVGRPGTKARAGYLASFRQQYHPVVTGIHVCGFNNDLPHGPAYTLLNLPLEAAHTRAVFNHLKAAFSVGAADGEVLIDFMVDGFLEDNFWIRRQMLEPFKRAASAQEEV